MTSLIWPHHARNGDPFPFVKRDTFKTNRDFFNVRISVQYNEENIAVLLKMGYCMEHSCEYSL